MNLPQYELGLSTNIFSHFNSYGQSNYRILEKNRMTAKIFRREMLLSKLQRCEHLFVPTEPVHQSFLMCYLRSLTSVLPLSFVGDHTQEAESWKPIIHEHFLRGTVICFHVSKLVLKTPTTESFSSFVDSKSGQIQEQTYFHTGFQKQRKSRVREENCASIIIIQRELLHKREFETV